MKSTITTLLLFFITGVATLQAQDTIIKTNQEEIEAKVIEISEKNIRYKIWTRQDGPVYNIAKKDVFMILYSSGDKEYYTDKKPTIEKPKANVVTKKTTPERSTNDGSSSATEKDTTNEGGFVYREGGKLNFGFGYDASGGDGVIAIGAFAPYAFTSNSKGSIELEVGGTLAFYNGLGIGGDNNTSIYFLSLTGGYGYFVLDSLKVSAGLGYYFGFGNTRTDISTNSFTVDDIYYHTGVEYWFTNGFGMNARYDALLGPSVGILFSSF